MRTSILFFVFFLTIRLLSQTNFKIDTAEITEFDHSIKPYYDHFYIEYMDFRLNQVSREKAQLKCYTFYQKDKKCNLYPQYTLFKEDCLYLDNKKIEATDSVILMNGLFNLKDKSGIVYEEILYVNGFVKKHVQKGKKITEYDYSTFPFQLHYIEYGKPGEIKRNFYAWNNQNTQIFKKTNNLMSDNILIQSEINTEIKELGYSPEDKDQFLIEQLDSRLNPNSNKKKQFRRYSFYQNSKKCKLYPINLVPKKNQLLLNDNGIRLSDTTTLMNGIFKMQDKKGRIYEEILYVNGYLKKHIVKGGSLWRPRIKGKVITEIAEYDYTTFPFRLHYIKYDIKGRTICNYYFIYDNKAWISYPTNTLISTDIKYTME